MFLSTRIFYGIPRLRKKIRQYDYFGYSHQWEALFLSWLWGNSSVNGIIANIKNEYKSNIDKFSQDVIAAQLEPLFTLCERFYERQFITRKITNSSLFRAHGHGVDSIFQRQKTLSSKGLPSVKLVADKLNISAKYLSSLLKQLIRQTTQSISTKSWLRRPKRNLSTIRIVGKRNCLWTGIWTLTIVQ